MEATTFMSIMPKNYGEDSADTDFDFEFADIFEEDGALENLTLFFLSARQLL